MCMFVYFSDNLHCKDTPEGQTIHKKRYLQILCRIDDAVQGKRPGMWTRKNCSFTRQCTLLFC